MELENQTNPASTEALNTPATPSTAPETTNAPAVSSDALTPDAQAAQVPEFKPDFKFKVMDKEHEIEPLFHPIIKDEEALKKVRRLYEQSLGTPHLEASRDEWKTKYTTALPRLQEYERVGQRLDNLSHLIKIQDFGGFFNELQIPRDAVFKWAKQELELMDAPQEVRQQRDQYLDTQRKLFEAERKLQQYEPQVQTMQQQQVFQQVDNTITQLAGDIASQFNERMAEPSAFRNAVINRGYTIQQQTGQKAPIEEVIALVKQDLSRVMGLSEGAAPNAQDPAAAAAQAAPQGKPPVIPVVKAGGASPVKTPPKSIADLKRIHDSL